MAQQAFDYRFHYGEPGLFLEIYVPRAYQDILRDTIEKGFDLDFVRAHLKASDNACEVRQLLQDHETLATYDEARVNRLNPVLDLYSIYRGDGAFFNEGHLRRDDVCVVRMMFLPALIPKSLLKNASI